MTNIVCIECGKSYKAQRSSAKFCSTNCRVKWNYRNREAQVANKAILSNEPKEPSISKVIFYDTLEDFIGKLQGAPTFKELERIGAQIERSKLSWQEKQRLT